MGMGPVKSQVYAAADEILSSAVRQIDHGVNDMVICDYIGKNSGMSAVDSMALTLSLKYFVKALNDASERSH